MTREPNDRSREKSSQTASGQRFRSSKWTLAGLLAGIVCGVFFGDYCEPVAAPPLAE